MNKTVGILLVLLVLGGVTYKLMQPKPSEDFSLDSVVTKDSPIPTEPAMVVKEDVIIVEGSPFKFVPNTITIKKGVVTKIVFKNLKGSHDFVVDGLGVRSKTLKEGEEEVVEFTSEKAGSFEYYCSVGNHKAQGMTGTIIVE